MDVRMPRLDGIEAARRIAALGSGASRVVMLTSFDVDEYAFDALSAGATGFLLKHARPEELLFGIRAAAAAHALVAPALTRRRIERFPSLRPRAALSSSGSPSASGRSWSCWSGDCRTPR